jgi:hypothetical protein
VKFQVTHEDKAAIIVQSDRWWDARLLATIHFGCEPGQLLFESDPQGPVTIQTRWEGRSPGLHLEFRIRSETTVIRTDWRPIEEYAEAKRVSDAINSATQPTQ